MNAKNKERAHMSTQYAAMAKPLLFFRHRERTFKILQLQNCRKASLTHVKNLKCNSTEALLHLNFARNNKYC